MGTLRSTQWTETITEEGTIINTPTCRGYAYNGVTLGEPIELDGNPMTAEWNDGAFPDGICEVVDDILVVTPDEEEL